MVYIAIALLFVFSLGVSFVIKNILLQKNNWKNKFNDLNSNLESFKQQLAYSYEKNLKRINDNFQQENVHFLAQALTGESALLLKNEMESIVTNSYSDMSQELLGNISDETGNASLNLNLNLSEKLWDSIQQFKTINEQSPYILPSNCKIAYTKGCRTVVIVEQFPQIRTIALTSDLVSPKCRKESVSTTTDNYRFSLAFPYVYFLIVFDHEKYTSHELYFKNNMLTSVNEHLHLAPIPNVFRDRSKYSSVDRMCMGTGFKEQVQKKSTVARQVDIIVSDFWIKTFNDHLGTGGFEKLDKRIKNWSTWQTNSKLDQFFILDVKWPKGRTIKGIVDSTLDKRPRESDLDAIDKTIKNIIDKDIGGIEKILKKEIESAKKNNKINIKKIKLHIDKKLELVLSDHAKKVFNNCIKN